MRVSTRVGKSTHAEQPLVNSNHRDARQSAQQPQRCQPECGGPSVRSAALVQAMKRIAARWNQSGEREGRGGGLTSCT